METLLEALLWGGVAAGITAATGRPADEIVAAGVGGAAVGAFVGEISQPSSPQAKCISEALEYLIITGEAEDVQFRDGVVSMKSPPGADPKAIEAVLLRCNPESVYTSKFGDTVIARF